jgi:hypothetical protein
MSNDDTARPDRRDEGAKGAAGASAEDHKAVVRRWIEAYNDRDEQAEAAARAPGYVAHAPGEPEPLDSEAWTRFIGHALRPARRLVRRNHQPRHCPKDALAPSPFLMLAQENIHVLVKNAHPCSIGEAATYKEERCQRHPSRSRGDTRALAPVEVGAIPRGDVEP